MSASKPAEDQLTQLPDDTDEPARPSRRRLLTGAALFGAGAVAGGLTGYFTQSADEPSGTAGADPSLQTIPFYGAQQAGIVTPAQDRLAFGTLNVVDGTSGADLRDLLRAWTGAAALMTAGKLVGEETEPMAPRWTPGRRSAPRSPG
jgi:deferrochelatase/peroxidase EfeB